MLNTLNALCILAWRLKYRLLAPAGWTEFEATTAPPTVSDSGGVFLLVFMSLGCWLRCVSADTGVEQDNVLGTPYQRRADWYGATPSISIVAAY